MLKFTKKYFAEKFTPLVRHLHYLILLLVLTQILLSNFMKISKAGVISHDTVAYYATWSHISIGLTLLLLAIIFIAIELKRHGFAYFYPYIFGDISQLKSDLKQLKTKRLPEAKPNGLAAIIQGLGLGALLLVASAGATWLLLWTFNSPLAHDAKETHEFLTGLIEAYVIGHGSMGLLHIFITYKKNRQSTIASS